MKRIATIAAANFILLTRLFAGDVATFANLGFSEDSRYFMFGQYGVVDDGSGQYAELYVVDVASNRFVPGGALDASYDRVPGPEQTGFGALLMLFRDSSESFERYGVNHMEGGRLLYLLFDGVDPKPELNFRDFETGRSIRVDLLQSTFGEGSSVSASFHVNLTVARGENEKYYTVGLPDYRRPGVSGYQVRSVYASPDDSSLVFVIEKLQHAPSGVDVRYMVETVQID